MGMRAGAFGAKNMTRTIAAIIPAVVVLGASLGLGLAAWNLPWPVSGHLARVSHICAGLCLLWVVIAQLCRSLPEKRVAGLDRNDLISVLHIVALATGLGATITMVYFVVIEGLHRTLFFDFAATPRLELWRGGFLNLALVAGAILIAWSHHRGGPLVTAMFWVLALACSWASLRFPSVERVVFGGAGMVVATRWPVYLMASLSAVVALFVVAGGWASRKQRARAWPADLDRLTVAHVDWPGFRYSAGIVGAVILILGCIYVTSPGAGFSSLVAGVCLLVLAGRSWNENLADAGMALITLAVVAGVMQVLPMPADVTPSGRWAELINRALMGLAIMTFIWYWLAEVWIQQLDNGRAWTTTGLMVRTARRVGYLVGATGVLVAASLAIWPARPTISDRDVSLWRWCMGLSGHGLLFGALFFATRRTRRPTAAWLALMTLASTVAFVLTRSTGARFVEVWTRLWPLLLTIISTALIIMTSWAAQRGRARPFLESVYLTGAFFAPLIAILGVLMTPPQLRPAWLPAVTFASLVVTYLLAAYGPGPRTFIAVAALCAVMSLWGLREITGGSVISPFFFYPTMVSFATALLAWVVQHRLDTRPVKAVKWASGGAAVLIFLIGLIVTAI